METCFSLGDQMLNKPKISMISLKESEGKTIVATAVLSAHQEIHFRFSDNTILSLEAIKDYDEAPSIEWGDSKDTPDYTVLYALKFITEAEKSDLQREEEQAMQKFQENAEKQLYQRLKKKFESTK
jgi:hypothetical protein